VSRLVHSVTVIAILVTGSYGHALAQNSRLKPNLDVVVAPIATNRAKGFNITAGGSQNLRMTLNGQPGESWGSAALVYNYNASKRLSTNCDGFVSDAPNMRFHYVAAALPDIRVLATSETTPFTLVVRAPNGSFYCSYAKGLIVNGAVIMFIAPPSGQYDIWVGYLRPGEVHKATITLLTMAPKKSA